jgi:hypothetical protein
MKTFRVRAIAISDSTVTVVVVNVLMALAEIVALLVANPLPFMQPETLPYWMAAQGILNIIIKYVSKMSD